MDPTEVIERFHLHAFLREIASYSYGAEFRAALQANLDLVGHAFPAQDEFWGRLGSKRRSETLSAISELWLAAYFSRTGSQVGRFSQANVRIPDFRLSSAIAKPDSGQDQQVEAKRLFGSRDGAPDAKLSVWDGPREWPSVPGTFGKSDFVALLRPRLSRARKQFTGAGRRVFAVDISESTTFQRLLVTDSTPSAVLLGQLGLRGTESLLIFVVGLNRPELWAARWLRPLPDTNADRLAGGGGPHLQGDRRK
jgi:hypothetical protein